MSDEEIRFKILEAVAKLESLKKVINHDIDMVCNKFMAIRTELNTKKVEDDNGY